MAKSPRQPEVRRVVKRAVPRLAWVAVLGYLASGILGIASGVTRQGWRFDSSVLYGVGINPMLPLVAVLLVGWAFLTRRKADRTLPLIRTLWLALMMHLAFSIGLIGQLPRGEYPSLWTWLFTVLNQVLVLVLYIALVIVLHTAAMRVSDDEESVLAVLESEEHPHEAPGRERVDDQPALEPVHQRPTWQPDQASGAVWSSASGAATGQAASGWGEPGRPRSGWQAERPGDEDRQFDDQTHPAERPSPEEPGVGNPTAEDSRARRAPDWGI